MNDCPEKFLRGRYQASLERQELAAGKTLQGEKAVTGFERNPIIQAREP
jgi:hypothetical protein